MSENTKQEEVKALAVATEKWRTLLKHFPGAAVFGFVLNSDPQHPIAAAITAHWSELHHLTGSKIVLMAFQPPAQWSDRMKGYWHDKLGADFNRTWAEWTKSAEPGLAFDYLDLFERPAIKPTELPCLVLFTDPDKRDAVVRSLPSWDEASLYRLLLAMVEDIRACADLPEPERLAALQKALSSPSARFADYVGHLKDQAADYVKKNPAKVVLTSVSFVLALASASVIPLGVGMVGVLTAVKETFSKGA